MIKRSCDATCDPHRTRGGDEKHRFFDLDSKPVAMFYQWFGLKTTVAVSWFATQNQGQMFSDLGLKITITVSWFVPQNQVGGGLSVCTSKLMEG
jgi:hypothetical protein